MIALLVVMTIMVLLLVAAVAATAWYCRPAASTDRAALARREVLLAEAHIDLLTRRTMQQMRDIVRDEQRGRSQGRVIDGDVLR